MSETISSPNAQIRIVKIETGYQVFFAYALKDSFRKALPSAKWDSSNKCWTVGTRSLKKVQAWAEHAEPVATQIADEKKAQLELDSTELEFRQALRMLDDLKGQLKSVKDLTERKTATLAKLSAILPQIEKVKHQLAVAKAEHNAVVNQLADIVDGLIDMNAIDEAIGKMRKMRALPITSKNRSIFETAQAFINEQRQILKQAGVGSYGLDDLWRLNWNRPDRDRIGDCRQVDDFYYIEPESQES